MQNSHGLRTATGCPCEGLSEADGDMPNLSNIHLRYCDNKSDRNLMIVTSKQTCPRICKTPQCGLMRGIIPLGLGKSLHNFYNAYEGCPFQHRLLQVSLMESNCYCNAYRRPYNRGKSSSQHSCKSLQQQNLSQMCSTAPSKLSRVALQMRQDSAQSLTPIQSMGLPALTVLACSQLPHHHIKCLNYHFNAPLLRSYLGTGFAMPC